MNDRFKLRVWDKSLNDFWNEPLIKENLYCIFFNTKNDENIVVEKCIGFRDKKNKQIYEGDIIDIEGKKHKIIYSESLNSFGMTDGNFFYDFCRMLNIFTGTLNGEVIGNIHETPELLKR